MTEEAKLPWGEGEPTAENACRDGACVQCNYYFYNARIEKYVVGVKEAPYPSRSGCYALMYECPRCFQINWNHAPELLSRKEIEEAKKTIDFFDRMDGGKK